MTGIIIKIVVICAGAWFTWRRLRRFLPPGFFKRPKEKKQVDSSMSGVKLEKDPETGKFRPANSDLNNE